MEDNSKVFLAALAGAAVGAGIVLLFAPRSGKETRQKIADKLNDTKEDAEALAQKAKEKAKALKKDVENA